MDKNEPVTASYVLTHADVRYVRKVAKQNGDCTISAAMRQIIREHRQFASIKPDITAVSLTDKAQEMA